MQPQGVIESHSGAVSALSAFAGWVLNDLPVALVGVKLSAIIMAFSGVMLAFSVLPSTNGRRNWTTALLFTIGASALVNLGLRQAHLSSDYALGMGFLLGFAFPYLVLDRGRSVGAIVDRVRGRK